MEGEVRGLIYWISVSKITINLVRLPTSVKSPHWYAGSSRVCSNLSPNE